MQNKTDRIEPPLCKGAGLRWRPLHEYAEAPTEPADETMAALCADGGIVKLPWTLICTSKVRHFWGAYFYGKTGRKNKVYSEEFKIGVIMDMREHHLSYNKTVRRYWDISKGQEHNYKA